MSAVPTSVSQGFGVVSSAFNAQQCCVRDRPLDAEALRNGKLLLSAATQGKVLLSAA